MMKLLKKHKWKLLISSLLILSPMAAGLALWNRLPGQIAIHWGLDGKADGFASPAVAVFLLPLILLVLHFVLLWFTARDNKKNDQSPKVLGMIFWILPVLSVYVNSLVYATIFGLSLNPDMLTGPLLGLFFVVIGNYLPKCRRNRTVGIKIKWALESDENWNATHRFAGKVWVLCGIIALFSIFLPSRASMMLLIPNFSVAALLPVAYSYAFHKKQLKSGTDSKSDQTSEGGKGSKIGSVISVIVVIAILVLTLTICFTGNVKYHFDDSNESFTATASYYTDLTVRYEDVVSFELREDLSVGKRLYGVGSPRLSVGNFQNEEFGEYLLYSYTACKSYVVLTDKEGKVIVLNRPDKAQTEGVYEEILGRFEKHKEATEK
jgi:uncharacterized membrane protein